jgi:L-threonylcarbamoyladenylate synthase
MTDREHLRPTSLLTVSADVKSDPAITQAAQLLREGRLVAFPTETVYGLGANALDAEAVASIFAAKERPLSDPLIVHIGDSKQVMTLVETVPHLAVQLMSAFWPGPLTLVMRRAAAVPEIVAAGGPTVGVRIPNHPVALALLRAAGIPVAAPSANRFMHTSPTTALHVLADLNGRIDCILDGGPSRVGIESTVLDMTSNPVRILRPGAVTREALRALIPDVSGPETDETTPRASPALAPGQMERHYAPRTPLLVFDAEGSSALAAIHGEVERAQARGERVGVLLAGGEEAAVAGLAVEVVWLGPANRLDLISASLYAALRDMDHKGVDVIITHTFGMYGLGFALWDRLRRASGGHFQKLHSS